MNKTKEQTDKAQASYKKNSDPPLCKQPCVIHEDDYMYLMVRIKTPKDHINKLAPITEGPFKVLRRIRELKTKMMMRGNSLSSTRFRSQDQREAETLLYKIRRELVSGSLVRIQPG